MKTKSMARKFGTELLKGEFPKDMQMPDKNYVIKIPISDVENLTKAELLDIVQKLKNYCCNIKDNKMISENQNTNNQIHVSSASITDGVDGAIVRNVGLKRNQSSRTVCTSESGNMECIRSSKSEILERQVEVKPPHDVSNPELEKYFNKNLYEDMVESDLVSDSFEEELIFQSESGSSVLSVSYLTSCCDKDNPYFDNDKTSSNDEHDSRTSIARNIIHDTSVPSSSTNDFIANFISISSMNKDFNVNDFFCDSTDTNNMDSSDLNTIIKKINQTNSLCLYSSSNNPVTDSSVNFFEGNNISIEQPKKNNCKKRAEKYDSMCNKLNFRDYFNAVSNTEITKSLSVDIINEVVNKACNQSSTSNVSTSPSLNCCTSISFCYSTSNDVLNRLIKESSSQIMKLLAAELNNTIINSTTLKSGTYRTQSESAVKIAEIKTEVKTDKIKPELNLQKKNEIEAEVKPDIKLEIKSETKPEIKSVIKSEKITELINKTENKTELNSINKSVNKTELKSIIKSKNKDELKPTIKAANATELISTNKSEKNTELKSTAKFENKTELKSINKSANITDVTSTVKSENKTELKSIIKSENILKLKSTIKFENLTELKSTVKSQDKTELKCTVKTQNETEVKSTVTFENKTELKSQHKTKMKSEKKSEVKSVIKSEKSLSQTQTAKAFDEVLMDVHDVINLIRGDCWDSELLLLVTPDNTITTSNDDSKNLLSNDKTHGLVKKSDMPKRNIFSVVGNDKEGPDLPVQITKYVQLHGIDKIYSKHLGYVIISNDDLNILNDVNNGVLNKYTTIISSLSIDVEKELRHILSFFNNNSSNDAKNPPKFICRSPNYKSKKLVKTEVKTVVNTVQVKTKSKSNTKMVSELTLYKDTLETQSIKTACLDNISNYNNSITRIYQQLNENLNNDQCHVYWFSKRFRKSFSSLNVLKALNIDPCSKKYCDDNDSLAENNMEVSNRTDDELIINKNLCDENVLNILRYPKLNKSIDRINKLFDFVILYKYKVYLHPNYLPSKLPRLKGPANDSSSENSPSRRIADASSTSKVLLEFFTSTNSYIGSLELKQHEIIKQIERNFDITDYIFVIYDLLELILPNKFTNLLKKCTLNLGLERVYNFIGSVAFKIYKKMN